MKFRLSKLNHALLCCMAEIIIDDLTPRDQYTATASQTVFDYNFPVFDETHIVVQQTLISDGTTSTLTLSTHYTVQDVGVATGGTITLVTGTAVGDIITVSRDVPVERETDFVLRGDFKAATVNREFDLIIMMLQELELDLQRSITLPSEDSVTTIALPNAADRASALLGFDANGELLMSGGSSSVSVSAVMTAVVQAATLAAARVAMGFFEGVVSPAQITANQNDYAPTGIATAGEIRVDSDAPRDITGISASQTDERDLVFTNDGAFAITLKHSDANSTAANRFDFGGDADTEIKAGASVRLRYDGTASRWRLVGGAGSGGSGGVEDSGGNVIGYANKQITAGDYTTVATENMLIVGDFEIDTGHTITISSGSRVVIV